MASAEDIAALRKMINEPDATSYDDTFLGTLIDNSATLNVAAAAIWREKATAYSEMVDYTESGSSRKNSILYERALAQADYYATADGETPEPGSYSTTRPIVRA